MKTKLITKSFERLLEKGLHRGLLPTRNLENLLENRNAHQNLEKALLILFEKKTTLVSKNLNFNLRKRIKSIRP